jgi:D-serine deaminase-like pyridoxal phosphate-dependent protein
MPAFQNDLRERYASALGQPKEALLTPSLLLDRDVLLRNIRVAAERLAGAAALRPHAKSHKCAEIARLQIQGGGVVGFTVATLWEALALHTADAGLDRFLIANEIVGPEKCRHLAEAAREMTLLVAVDAVENAAQLSAAAQAAGSEIGVLVDVDTGMKRCGVRTPADARTLAERVDALPGLRLQGLTGYEGHCMLEPDREARTTKAHAAMEYLVDIADSLRNAGLPIEIVSAGGTGTWDITSHIPGVTEVQIGSYVFLDATRGAYVSGLEVGLTVLATVASRQGETLVLDAGRKTISPEFTLPRPIGYPEEQIRVRGIAEEHLLCDVTPACPLRVGDVVEVVPGYAPLTVNLHEVYHVVQGGVVVDIWPILARGAGRGGNFI